MQREAPHDGDNDYGNSRPRITMEAVNDIILPKASDKPTDKIIWVKDLKEKDNELKDKWGDAVNGGGKFPEFDDGYDNNYFHDYNDQEQLENLPEVDRESELMDREERRNELKEIYYEYKNEYNKKGQKSSKSSQQIKRKQSDSYSSSSDSDSASESSLDDDNSESIDSSEDEPMSSTASSDNESDDEVEKPVKPRNQTQAPAKTEKPRFNDLKKAVIKGSLLRSLSDDDQQNLFKMKIYAFAKYEDKTEFVQIKKLGGDSFSCYLFESDSTDNIHLDNFTDDELTLQIYDILKFDGNAPGPRSLSNTAKFITAKSNTSENSDVTIDKRFKLAMDGKIPLATIRFEIQNSIVYMKRELQENGKDDESESANEIRDKIRKLEKMQQDINDKEEERNRIAEEKAQETVVRQEDPTKKLYNELSRRKKVVVKVEEKKISDEQFKGKLTNLFGSDDSDDDE